jgi:hypothetical protein
MSELLAEKAVEVCEAILGKTTFDFIQGQENYKWYIVLSNMLFFQSKIDWGTSVRGAWFYFAVVLSFR